MIDHLPRHSAFAEAVSQDEQLAKSMVDQGDSPAAGKGPRRRLSEFTPAVELLSVVADRVGELITVTAAVRGGGKPHRMKPMPRPTTALERIREKRRLAAHRSLVARVLPGKASR